MKKEIPAVYSNASDLHQPEFEYFNCRPRGHQDTPSRLRHILKSLQENRIADIHESDIYDATPFAAEIHFSEYLEFLQATSAQVARMVEKNGNPNEAVYPSVHRYVDFGRASNPIARRGLHVFDTYTPIMANTNRVALASAGVAVSGAKLLLQGENLVYSICRPSGHHAEKGMAGGMCYLNNAAIAAQFLLNSGKTRLAILDIDLHHGNGTQDIFYNRPDVLVININADPRTRFPHFTGYEEEHGQDKGEGYNINFPLPDGTDDNLYRATIRKALDIIKKYQPDCLLISAGFDTHETDPIGCFKLTTGYYKELGLQIKKLETPILVIQEGGYASDILGQNVVSFLSGLSCKK